MCKPGSALQFFQGVEANADRLQQYNGELVKIQSDNRRRALDSNQNCYSVPGISSRNLYNPSACETRQP